MGRDQLDKFIAPWPRVIHLADWDSIQIQRRPRIRAMLNRSNLLIVQNLISTEWNGLSCSKITLLIVQKPS